MSELIGWLRELDKKISELENSFKLLDKQWRNQIEIVHGKIDNIPDTVKKLTEQYFAELKKGIKPIEDEKEKIFNSICEKYYTDKYELLKKHLERMLYDTTMEMKGLIKSGDS